MNASYKVNLLCVNILHGRIETVEIFKRYIARVVLDTTQRLINTFPAHFYSVISITDKDIKVNINLVQLLFDYGTAMRFDYSLLLRMGVICILAIIIFHHRRCEGAYHTIAISHSNSFISTVSAISWTVKDKPFRKLTRVVHKIFFHV